MSNSLYSVFDIWRTGLDTFLREQRVADLELVETMKTQAKRVLPITKQMALSEKDLIKPTYFVEKICTISLSATSYNFGAWLWNSGACSHFIMCPMKKPRKFILRNFQQYASGLLNSTKFFSKRYIIFGIADGRVVGVHLATQKERDELANTLVADIQAMGLTVAEFFSVKFVPVVSSTVTLDEEYVVIIEFTVPPTTKLFKTKEGKLFWYDNKNHLLRSLDDSMDSKLIDAKKRKIDEVPTTTAKKPRITKTDEIMVDDCVEGAAPDQVD